MNIKTALISACRMNPNQVVTVNDLFNEVLKFKPTADFTTVRRQIYHYSTLRNQVLPLERIGHGVFKTCEGPKPTNIEFLFS